MVREDKVLATRWSHHQTQPVGWNADEWPDRPHTLQSVVWWFASVLHYTYLQAFGTETWFADIDD